MAGDGNPILGEDVSMADYNVDCPDCDRRMEIGFLPEITHQGQTGMTCWMPGPPNLRTFFGLKTGFVKVDWKQVFGVMTFRCPKCGLLKSYAVKPEESG